MTKNKLYLSAIILSASLTGLYACSKVEKGFLSNNLYYLENPLVTTQGAITVSSSIVADGSTTPINVELTKIVDSAGNDASAILGKTDSIQGFIGSVSYLDSTLALLNSKLATTAAKPFSINPIGGRIQLTPATQYVPAGTYTLSVKASNSRGTVDLPNACQIIINSTGAPFIDYGGTYGGQFDANTGLNITAVGVTVKSITYMPTAINKIVYKFLDRDGQVYNAKAGGITNRKGRWSMAQFDPYYPEVLTDTSVEYQFPSVPNQFPVFANSGINNTPRGNYGMFPAIPQAHNSTPNPVFAFLDMAFFAKGTFIVTVQFTDVTFR